MTVLIRCNNIISDPRASKYVDFFVKWNIKYYLIGWDRTNTLDLPLNGRIFKLKSTFGKGDISAIIHRICWMIFVIYRLIIERKKIKTIHACDLDAAFPACVYKALFNKKVKVIFDVFDWYSVTLYNQKDPIKIAFRIMERFSIKYANEVIICEPERIEQIPYTLNKKELVFHNIPSFDDYSFLTIKPEYKFNNNNITISYVGGFYDERLLLELIQLTYEKNFNLLIAGYGSEEITRACIDANKLYNVKYLGKVAYKDGLNIMFNSDIIYAMYSKKNPNHIYAAPNKFYEAMLLSKPLVSTKGILLQTKIDNFNIGYCIDENITDIDKFIKHLDRSDLSIKGSNASTIWNNNFITMTKDFLEKTYFEIIN